MQFTPVEEIPQIVQGLRSAWLRGTNRSLADRLTNLRALRRLFVAEKEGGGRSEIEAALSADLHQSQFVANIGETDGVIQHIDEAIANLASWMKPQHPKLPLLFQPGSAERQPLAYGVVLVIGPFNYPISLVFKPLVGAIAAGNVVVIKPSEVSSHCSACTRRLCEKYLDPSVVRVVEGSIPETTVLLEQKFDYIFYTGSPMVGRVIMRAASEHLTPVTLELGGKCPCIVDSDVDLEVTAKRIIFGKFMNLGQTCVAPDYLIVKREIQSKLIDKLKETLIAFYGPDPRTSPEYSRIINKRHTQRIAKLLRSDHTVLKGELVCGGEIDEDDCYISPTIFNNVDPSSILMEDEIFGPVLPVIAIDSINEAIEMINHKPRPLALYIFSRNQQTCKHVLDNCISGGACINDTVMHVAVTTLPFGGVGESGMGNYNGKATFDTFTHYRSVLKKGFLLDSSLRYPPFTDRKIRTIMFLMTPLNLKKPLLLLSIIGLAIAAIVATRI